jgi:signal transduction histidine kinase
MLLILAAVVTEYVSIRSHKGGIPVDSVQEILFDKEKLADDYLLALADTLKDVEGFVQHNEDYSEYTEDIEEAGITLLVYKKRQLVLWTDNTISLPSLRHPSLLSKRFARLGNAFYRIKRYHSDSTLIVALILIKTDYPYQNQYLRNKFHPDFDLPPSAELVVDLRKGQAIYDENGEYLFSLEPGPEEIIPVSELNWATVLYVLTLLVILLFALVSIREIVNPKLRRWAILIFGVLLWGVREVMLAWAVPDAFYSLELFSPVLYAKSYYFSSLGDFTLNALFVFVWVYAIAKYADFPALVSSISSFRFFLLFFVFLGVTFLLFNLVVFWFKSLVIDSSISFQMYEFTDITIYTFLGYWAIVLLFYALILSCDVFISVCQPNCSMSHFYILVLILGGVFTLLNIWIVPSFDWLYALFLLGLLFLHGLIIYRGDPGFRYSLFIMVLIGVSVFLVYCINDFSTQKEREGRMIAAMNLSMEYDPTSDAMMSDLSDALESDTKLKEWCKEPYVNENRIMEYIQEKYFKGYWEQFQIQVTLCESRDDLRVEPDGRIRNCFEFFTEMIVESGEKIPGSNFYFLNNFNGMVSYLGVLDFITAQGRNVNIYLRVDSRLSDEGLGYPDLLLDEKFNRTPMASKYSFAKYKEGKLIASSGNFNYYLSSDRFGEGEGEYFWEEKDDYEHLVYRFDNNRVVVSTPSLSWYNRFITFPYVFVFFYVFAVLVWLLEKFPWKFPEGYSFKYRIQYSLVGVLMLFFILLGGGSVFYNIKQFQDKHSMQLGEKLRLAKRELFEDMYSGEELNQDRNPYLTSRLRRFSNVINADINLYDLKGNLLATSRPEIFEKELLGRKMNYKAYYQLNYQKRSQFIHQENMGELTYLSAYEPIVDEQNKIVAYLNLPYFTKNQELQQELFNLIIAGVNLHLFMILLAIFLSVIISNKITYPLKLIQDRFKKTKLGTKNEQIDYSKRDEIGSLVGEYNRMVVELEESAKLLARSERESAWREMARQVAHEIKNPLTPMKLNIQFLQKSLNDELPNWEKYFSRVSKSLIEQIDNLSAIATAFSNFAKMPMAKNEKENLVDVLRKTLEFFHNDEVDISLDLNAVTESLVYIDREQFARVYLNLINNAIQAIPEGREAHIKLELWQDEEQVFTAVHDNGMGISDEVKERLFEPNFTTKSSGMGLGLAIVKNIVKNAGGQIWVKTQLGKGSSFYICLPLMKTEEE